MIELKGVCQYYGATPVLKHIDLRIEWGGRFWVTDLLVLVIASFAGLMQVASVG